MLPVGWGTASLFTRDLLEKPSWLLFITFLYIHPRRVNRVHLALPHFVLVALSPMVMNKTRPNVLSPASSSSYPGAANCPQVPAWHHQQIPTLLPIPSMVTSAFASPSSSSLPTCCPQELV